MGRGLPPGRPPSRPTHRCPRLTESWASRPPWLLQLRRRLWVQLPNLYCLPNRLSNYGSRIAGFLGWPEVTPPPSSAAIILERPAQHEQWSPNTRWRRAGSLGAASEVTRTAQAQNNRALSTSRPPGYTSIHRFTCCAAALPPDARDVSDSAGVRVNYFRTCFVFWNIFIFPLQIQMFQ